MTVDILSKKIRKLDDSSYSSNKFETGSHGLVYLTTNEERVDSVRGAIEQIPTVPQSCHIGFSGWHNLDIASLRKSTYVIICDVNPFNKLLIEKTVEIVKKTLNRSSFVQEMCKYIKSKQAEDQALQRPNNERLSFSLNFKTDIMDEFETIEKELTRPGSWLSSDAHFNHIRSLSLQDRIVGLMINLLDTERFQKISTLCQNNNIVIDSLYLSNISHYIHEEEKQIAYASTVRALVDSDTIVIHCPNMGAFFPEQNRFFISRLKSNSHPPYQIVERGLKFQTPENGSLLFKLTKDSLPHLEAEELKKDIFELMQKEGLIFN
jgi:hypothetical protein